MIVYQPLGDCVVTLFLAMTDQSVLPRADPVHWVPVFMKRAGRLKYTI